MRISVKPSIASILIVGVFLGASFAIFDSFCDYLDTAPVEEELLHSLWKSIAGGDMLKIGVYVIIGLLSGGAIVLFYSAIQRIYHHLTHRDNMQKWMQVIAEIRNFAVSKQEFFEAMQNEERDRSSLVPKS